MGLREYFKKRRFSQTPEPHGKNRAESKKPGKKTKHVKHSKLQFVVHEHAATRHHYDLRLEMGGVLKSWAVPKGPSLDPHIHHLAIQTEDHPFEYRNFEGVIPKGNYGAGNTIIWDAGWYEARQKDQTKHDEKTLLAELKKGHITFVLHGQKLRGEFALIKMPNAREENAWLLIKKGDEFASSNDITQQNESIKSHKTVEQIGQNPRQHRQLPDMSAYPKVSKPWQVAPMLATLAEEPFSKPSWIFEVKWDGYRAIASKKKDDNALYSRNFLDFSTKFPLVYEALHELKHDVILDGEIVTIDAEGNPHFEWLQNYGRTPRGDLRYYVFDILWCNGHDVRDMSLVERKNLLQAVLPKNSIMQYSDHIEQNGEQLFAEMRRRGLEGMIAKDASSSYREGVRGRDWLKIKTHQRQEVVIGGYTEPRGGRKYLGALVVGVYDKAGNFVYVGHSGGGIADAERKELWQKLSKLERKTSPFEVPPKPNAPVHWVKPEMVCEMSFAEWTHENNMRQPKYEGLRPDKNPRNIHREKPKHVKELLAMKPDTGKPKNHSQNHDGLPFEFTHPDKIFFPKHKYTKGDVRAYYESVAEYILPYLKNRPCSLNRMPDGINGQSFYQKNNPHLPDWVPHADIFSESNNADLRWVVGDNLEALLYMVQLGCIEINPWNSRVGHLQNPDWIVIDLDPEGQPFKAVIEVARTVKAVCDEWRIPNYPKTSGKTGIHIYIPMQAKYSYEQGKNLAHLIVLEVNKRQPKITSVLRMPEKRRHKIYLDFLQNREGQTLAAPYSLRPTPDATVSMPLHWDEVNPSLKPTDFTIKNALARLNQTGDLWKPALAKGIDLARILAVIEKQNKENA